MSASTGEARATSAAGAMEHSRQATRSGPCFCAGWSPGSPNCASSGPSGTWRDSSTTTSVSVTAPRCEWPAWPRRHDDSGTADQPGGRAAGQQERSSAGCVDPRRRLDLGTRPPHPPRHEEARELGAALQVRRGRRDRLRHQPDRLCPPHRDAGPLPPPRRRRLILRRGHQQLPLEPPLDLPRHRGPRGLSGGALLRRERPGPGHQPPLALSPGRRGLGAGVAVAGDRGRPRDALQLPRQQAVDVRSGSPLTQALRRAALTLATAAAVLLIFHTSGAGAQTTSAAGSTPGSKPGSPSPAGTTGAAAQPATNISENRAIKIARTDPQVAAERERYGPLDPSAQSKPGTWQVDFYADGTDRVQVVVDDATGQIRETWTGYQIAWQMARGYSGQFGHKLNAPYIWIPLAVIFLLGLVDFRRKSRMVHLDLLVLLSFGISEIYFNDGNIGVSVPLAYPPLLYLLVRMTWVGFRGAGEGLRPSTPTAWLAIAGAFLLGFRIALNIADSGVIDVGYAGAIGAEHLTHGQAIWNNFPSDNSFGDTYGPFNYYAYVPFELALPWSGTWDNLPAAHAAAIFFDLATVGGLFALGRRLRPGPDGTRLGVIFGFAWAAYPFTDYALQSNSNDALVAALLVWALVLFASPVWRAVMLGLSVATKFAPLQLAPLFAAGESGF